MKDNAFQRRRDIERMLLSGKKADHIENDEDVRCWEERNTQGF